MMPSEQKGMDLRVKLTPEKFPEMTFIHKAGFIGSIQSLDILPEIVRKIEKLEKYKEED